jgi:hypothetical protein
MLQNVEKNQAMLMKIATVSSVALVDSEDDDDPGEKNERIERSFLSAERCS